MRDQLLCGVCFRSKINCECKLEGVCEANPLAARKSDLVSLKIEEPKQKIAGSTVILAREGFSTEARFWTFWRENHKERYLANFPGIRVIQHSGERELNGDLPDGTILKVFAGPRQASFKGRYSVRYYAVDSLMPRLELRNEEYQTHFISGSFRPLMEEELKANCVLNYQGRFRIVEKPR